MLVEFIQEGLVKENKENNVLGDRTQYIGASDVGSCLKKAYLDKVNPQEKDPQTLAVLMRGHLAEELIKKAFNANRIHYKEQVELQEDFIKAHLDFVFCTSKECIVIEAKSTNNIPDSPYSSWILQIQLQMYLAQKHYGLKTRGYIFVINLNTGEMKEFSIEPNEDLQKVALDRAKKLWEALQNGIEPEAEEQLFCSKCPHKNTCPLFQAEEIHFELDEIVNDIVYLEATKKEIDKDLKLKKEELQKFLEEKGLKKVQVSNYILSISNSSNYVSLDTTKLKKENPDLWNELVSNYGKQITRKGSLKIK